MKTTTLRTPQQIITAIEEDIPIEELIYKGKSSELLGEQFAKMPRLRKITLGENSKYTQKHLADYITRIPNLEEVTLLQDVIFTEKLLSECLQKDSFKCLKLHYPSNEQLETLLQLFQEDKLKQFSLVQNSTADIKPYHVNGKFIESNMPLPPQLAKQAIKVDFDFYTKAPKVDNSREYSIEDLEELILSALKKGDKKKAFDLLTYLNTTNLSEKAQEVIKHYLTLFLEFDSVLIYPDFATQLDSLLQDNLFEQVFFFIFQQAKELEIINLGQEYQSYISLFENIERLKFITLYQDNGFPQDNFEITLIQNPEKLESLILQGMQVEGNFDLSLLTNLKGLTLSLMPFTSLQLPTQLKEIALEDNERFYQLPVSLYKNKNLEYFKYSGEMLEFSNEIYQLKNLKQLFFSFFGTHNFSLSPEVENLCNLESLIINNLSGLEDIPDSITNLKKLHTLHLYGQYTSMHPDIFLLPKLNNICMDSSEWTGVPNTLNQCKALQIQVRGLKLKRVPMQQMKRLGYEFQFDSDGFRNSDFMEFFAANNQAPLPVDQYKDFFEVLLANPTNHTLSQKNIRLFYNVIWLDEPKYSYEFMRKLQFFNPNCKSVVDIELPQGNREIVVIGCTNYSGQMLKTNLEKIGFTWAAEISEKTTHILVGEHAEYEEILESRSDLVYCTDHELAVLFSKYGMNQLLLEQGKSMIPQIEKMLFSPVEMNINLGLEMLKNLGVPSELHLHLLALNKSTETRAIALATNELLRVYCSDKAILQVLDDSRELFTADKDGYDKYVDLFFPLNNNNDWSDYTDNGKQGYICAHMVWKFSKNAASLAYLINKIERGEVGIQTPYFENNWLEIQADSDKHLVYA
ncbi:MAG: hypothetical protein N4A49_12065 [Marinifilaceae bacterium]|jgi:hypothetical protein|nr:hypothetical protein [Marinifilaceae bacterium]